MIKTTLFHYDLHVDRYDFPDTLIDHNTEYDYSIIICDGRASRMEIDFLYMVWN